ncbi:MAG: TIGR03087 family PEP-CTERM/XrtA system glycosyltransferase, partial [Acetobacteraceae bacterium]
MPELLFVSHRFPYPLNKGEKIRAYHLLRHLAPHWRIRLGCLVEDPADLAHLPVLGEICAEVAAFRIDKRLQKLKALARFRPGRPLMLDYYRHPGLRRWVAERLPGAKLAYIFSTAMAPYVLDQPATGAVRLLDMQDIDSEKWTRYAADAAMPMRAVWAREGRTLLAYERHAAAACAATFFVTAAEARRFGELAPEVADRLDHVECGVDLGFFSPAHEFPSPYPASARRAVFTGNMDYWPNADAVSWFATEILPRITPRPEFWIVGANPGPAVRRLAGLPGVHVTGRVADVRPYLAHADVSVSPLRIARGIQNKVLEAMAAGRPVVASPGAFQGIRAQPGRDLLVADGATAIAEAVGAVLLAAGVQFWARAPRVAGHSAVAAADPVASWAYRFLPGSALYPI